MLDAVLKEQKRARSEAYECDDDAACCVQQVVQVAVWQLAKEVVHGSAAKPHRRMRISRPCRKQRLYFRKKKGDDGKKKRKREDASYIRKELAHYLFCRGEEGDAEKDERDEGRVGGDAECFEPEP